MTIRPVRRADELLAPSNINQFLTKFVYLKRWASGARVLVLQAGRNRRHATMALDPEEFVTLTDHGTMKLHAAVLRAMTLPLKERKRAIIVREGKRAALKFEQIKDLAAQWEQPSVPID
jgi:hypothetical protein